VPGIVKALSNKWANFCIRFNEFSFEFSGWELLSLFVMAFFF
jgi:hypothetical protein